jgi:hypothetical protein
VADIFLSSSDADAAAAARLAQGLAREGYALAGAIEGARAVIVLWSEAAARSAQVRADAERARSARTLVQLSADGRRPPMPFSQLHFVSLVGWQGEADHPGWARAKESLRLLLSR